MSSAPQGIIQVVVQSGSGGGLLTITTIAIDGISFGSSIQAQSLDYQQWKGNTLTAFRSGPVDHRSTFTGTTTGAALNMICPQKFYTIQVKGTGGVPTAWDVRLEVSIDNANWTEIGQHATVDGDGVLKFLNTDPKVSLYARFRCAGLTLGPATNIVAWLLASPN